MRFHTEFNLTYPMETLSKTGETSPEAGTNANDYVTATLAGLVVPHMVCTIFIFARLWTRLTILQKWYVDDTIVIAAWACSTAVCCIYTIAAQMPNIRQVSVSPASGQGGLSDHAQPYTYRTYMALIFYQLCLCLTKLSILTFYLRMFVSRPIERRLAWATFIFVAAYGLPLLFMSIFQCHPAPGEFFGQPMRCFSFAPLLITSSSLHAATDAWIILLIVPCVVQLKLPSRQKAALVLVLSLGIFVIAASMTRLQLSLRSTYTPSDQAGNLGEGIVGRRGGTGAGASAAFATPAEADAAAAKAAAASEEEHQRVADTLAFFIMTILECDVALICASTPMLRPLFARLSPRLLGLAPLRASLRQPSPDSSGVDLTSVVSYHGYPWTRPGTPMPMSTAGSKVRSRAGTPQPQTRSKNRSRPATRPGTPLYRSRDRSRHGSSLAVFMPTPPLPAAVSRVQRTPANMSLRSFIGARAPARRAPAAAAAADLADEKPILSRDDEVGRWRLSAGSEAYCDHVEYGGCEGEAGGEGRVKIPPPIRTDGVGRSQWRWGDSQESCVVGMNDPASPKRLSPMSGLSGSTYAALRDVDLENRKSEEKAESEQRSSWG